MADQVTELIYEGPPALVGLLGQMLREEGLSVSYDPPQETRDADSAMLIAAVVLQVTGPIWPPMWRAVRKFREHRLGSGAVVRGPAELEQSLEERLATLDRLRDEGTITPEEHAQQRARLLDEL